AAGGREELERAAERAIVEVAAAEPQRAQRVMRVCGGRRVEIAVLVDPGQIGREDVGIADILVLGIERDIRLAVGRPMFARALRMGIGLDAEGAEGERVARPILLPRRAPIGRDPADARAESAVERSRPAGRAVAEAGIARAIAAELEINVVI